MVVELYKNEDNWHFNISNVSYTIKDKKGILDDFSKLLGKETLYVELQRLKYAPKNWLCFIQEWHYMKDYYIDGSLFNKIVKTYFKKNLAFWIVEIQPGIQLDDHWFIIDIR